MPTQSLLRRRLNASLLPGERILETLYSTAQELYAATTHRILCFRAGGVGYALRVHPYARLSRVYVDGAGDRFIVRLFWGGRSLEIPAQHAREADAFAQAVAQEIIRLYPGAP